MSSKLLLLVGFVAVLQSGRSNELRQITGSYIIGGHDARPGQFPYQVSLQWEKKPGDKGKHFCGGTILDQQWILTAQHCLNAFEEAPPNGTLVVKAGKNDISKEECSEQVVDVEQYFKHTLYNKTFEIGPYDIGLIKLQTPLKLNKRVAKAVLPKKDSEPKGQVVMSGWGAINSDTTKPISPDILQTVTVPIVARKRCNEAIKKSLAENGLVLNEDLVHETHICSGPLTGGISACPGDSGGPLARKNDDGDTEVVGIAAWILKPCGRKGAPAVFVRVSSFVDWIEYIIENY